MTEFYQDSGAGNEWSTPDYITEPLSHAIGGFDLDPASGCEDEPIAKTCYAVTKEGLEKDWTIAKDGLKNPFFGNVWCNPPYGRKYNEVWAEKFAEETKNSMVDTITTLVPASTSSNWFQNYYCQYATGFCFLDHRIQFGGSGDHSASFDSVIVYHIKRMENKKMYYYQLDQLGTRLEHPW